MPLNRILICTLLLLLTATAFPLKLASADPLDPGAPPGFHLLGAASGVYLYQKDYKNGNPDFVQVVDLNQGASVEVLHGEVIDLRSGKGVYGGNDASLKYRSLEQYWEELTTGHSSAFCVTNGQFFYMRENPTRLPFPLKKDGKMITDGYETNFFTDQKLMLEIWPDRLDIRPLTRAALYTSTAADIIGGLSEEANKKAQHSVGRTFVGIDDRDLDGRFEILLVFNTLTARQKDAARVLRDFGADKVMMLDGGGSTQLICQGKGYIDSDRFIPQALGILAGATPTPQPETEALLPDSPPPFSAAIVTRPEWHVLIADETRPIEIEIQNTSRIALYRDEYQLVVEKTGWGEAEKIPIEADLQPGERVRLSWNAGPVSSPGIYTGWMHLARGGEGSPEGRIEFRLVALTSELEGRERELEREIELLEDQGQEGVERLVQEWVLEQTGTPHSFNIFAVIWIPAVILPLAIFLIYSIHRRR